tara:strand:+ start:165 stop:491 length:327 start_codon:yes stop_codon:yes gene_type:complete
MKLTEEQKSYECGIISTIQCTHGLESGYIGNIDRHGDDRMLYFGPAVPYSFDKSISICGDVKLWSHNARDIDEKSFRSAMSTIRQWRKDNPHWACMRAKPLFWSSDEN